MTAAADNEPKRAWSAASRAFAWWLGELRAIWDDATRRLDFGTRAAVVIETGERYWIVRRRQQVQGQIDRAAADPHEMRRGLTQLARTASGPSRLMVEIPHDRVLTSRLTLPPSAQGQIERVLHFEIGRMFPFPAERVYFRHRVIAQSSLAIEVEIVAVAREVVAEIIAVLEEAGLQASAICIAGSTGKTPLFLPVAALGHSRSTHKGFNRALSISLAVLTIGALASPILRNRLALAAVTHEIDTLRPLAQSRLDASEQQAREAARTASPLRLRAARPPLVAVLNELTKSVPDGAWLLSLNISGREIVIDGLSPSAAATALGLEQSGVFTNVVFRSPISRDPQTGLERFQLSVAIAEPKP